jgi:putative transposase
MVNYRCNRIRNGTYAFTITLRDRRSLLLVERMDALLASWRRARRRVPHRVVAFVVLPDHIHALVIMKDARICRVHKRSVMYFLAASKAEPFDGA